MYTLTKALAEHEVAKAHKLHPTVIVRPSMSKLSIHSHTDRYISTYRGKTRVPEA
jgi:Male sterility protein.